MTFRTIQVRKKLLLLLVTVILNQLLWINAIPYNFAPDEFSHFDIVERFVKTGRYPVFLQDPPNGILNKDGQTVVSYSALPPLPYMINSLILFPIKHQVNQKHWYLFARLASGVSIVVFTLIVFQLIFLLTKDQTAAYFAGAAAGFIPQVTFIGAYVTSDGITLALSSLLIYLAVNFVLAKQIKPIDCLISGVVLGAVVLSRINAFATLITALMLIGYRLQKEQGVKFKSMIVILSAFLVCGWWFIRNFLLFHDPFLLGKFYQILYDLRPSEFQHLGFWGLLTQTEWLLITLKSAYASFDWNFIYLPNWMYLPIAATVMLSILGFLDLLRHKSKNKVVYLIFVLGINLALIQAVIQSAYYSYQPQGRHLFPMLIGFMMLFFNGLRKFPYHKLILFALFIFILGTNIYSFLRIILPRYYAPTVVGIAFYKQAFWEIVFSKPFPFSATGFLIVLLGLIISLAVLLILSFKLIRKPVSAM